VSFNLRDWCPLHRQAVAALAAELADLRKFVSANVLNADEASRVAAKLSKADEKFQAVEASGESLILAFEADHPKESATGPGTDGGSIHDDTAGSEVATGPATTVATQTELSGAETLATVPGTTPDTVQGSAPAEPPATETPAPSTESPAGNSGSATPG